MPVCTVFVNQWAANGENKMMRNNGHCKGLGFLDEAYLVLRTRRSVPLCLRLKPQKNLQRTNETETNLSPPKNNNNNTPNPSFLFFFLPFLFFFVQQSLHHGRHRPTLRGKILRELIMKLVAVTYHAQLGSPRKTRT